MTERTTKMSVIMEEMSRTLLRDPDSSSSEADHVAICLANASILLDYGLSPLAVLRDHVLTGTGLRWHATGIGRGPGGFLFGRASSTSQILTMARSIAANHSSLCKASEAKEGQSTGPASSPETITSLTSPPGRGKVLTHAPGIKAANSCM